ncbi:MAG TPA: response regulator transcription factor [Longimicrobiales bacterium]|nr:response regulator transcription factor [Longimicrobiales bacterium]
MTYSEAAERDDNLVAVALIEDNRLVREGIEDLLNQLPGFEVVLSASWVDTEALRTARPDVVLLDLSLRSGDSLRATRRVKETLPETRIVLMDLLPVQDQIVEWVRAGVSGFVMKDASLEEVAGTLQSVAAGNDVLPPSVTGSLFTQIAKEAVAKGGAGILDSVRLTPREREVVSHVAEGMSNKQIAAELHITTHTVKSHVRNVMEKLTLHTRLQIAIYAHGQKIS